MARAPVQPPAHEQPARRAHGSVRGLTRVNRSSIDGSRFGRMFRWLPGETYRREDLSALATIMIQQEKAHVRLPGEAGLPPTDPVTDGPDIVFDAAPPFLDTPYRQPEAGDENPIIPAGYTYFGQFIDHDLTFDPNSSLQKQNDPDATEDFRTPRFDLDSLYGRGPDDQPYLYQDGPSTLGGTDGGSRFLLGAGRPGELPRNQEGRALTGDPRNDENNLICQLQVVFLHFHNRVVDTLAVQRLDLDTHGRFLEAQRIVRWHYQYLVLNDYLPRIVGHNTWASVMGPNGKTDPTPILQFYKPKDGGAYMPVEFSVAAFRFGHSMIRPSYALRAGNSTVDETIVGGGPGPFRDDLRFNRIPIFSDDRTRGLSLDGFGPLPPQWEINWDLFFATGDMPTQPHAAHDKDHGVLEVKPQGPGELTQPSYRIDATLVDPLAMLPPNVAKSGNMPDGIPSLAYRNLLRGSAFELPSGQNVARAFGLTPMSEADLWGGTDIAKLPANPFAFRAPLWYYILKESEASKAVTHPVDTKGGHFLGATGGRIVAEVLVGICAYDHTSYLYQDSHWTPAHEHAKSGFKALDKGGLTVHIDTMYKLIYWTTQGAMRF